MIALLAAATRRLFVSEWEIIENSDRGLGGHWGCGLGREKVLNFQVTNAGFYAFVLRKTIGYLWSETGTRGGVLKRCKTHGGWKFSRGSNPQLFSQSTRTL